MLAIASVLRVMTALAILFGDEESVTVGPQSLVADLPMRRSHPNLECVIPCPTNFCDARRCRRSAVRAIRLFVRVAAEAPAVVSTGHGRDDFAS